MERVVDRGKIERDRNKFTIYHLMINYLSHNQPSHDLSHDIPSHDHYLSHNQPSYDHYLSHHLPSSFLDTLANWVYENGEEVRDGR